MEGLEARRECGGGGEVGSKVGEVGRKRKRGKARAGKDGGGSGSGDAFNYRNTKGLVAAERDRNNNEATAKCDVHETDNLRPVMMRT